MSVEHVPEGADVVTFLGGLGVVDGTWVAGVGTLTEVVLAVLADDGEASRELPGRTQLLSLAGQVGGPLMATLVIPGASGVEGGRLVSGRSAGVVVFLTTGSVPQTGKVPAAQGRPVLPEVEDDEADESPRFGDRVDHFVFGLCDVMVVRDERMKIRDAAVGGGRLREIHLGAVKVLKPTTIDGRRVFKLVRK